MFKRAPAIVCRLLLLAACVPVPCAATSITATLIPSPPVYQEPLSVRLSDSLGPHCWPAATSTTQVGTVITLSLHFSDSCKPANATLYRDYPLGSFPAGSYVFIYESCANNPPPLPSACNTVLQLAFSVVAPPPPPIPSLSAWAMLALAAGLVLIGVRARRFRAR